MDIKREKPIHIGLLSAMPQELGKILENLNDIKINKFGDLTVYQGIFKTSSGREVYISTAWSGWGKVSAARATTRVSASIFLDKKINLMIFTGVAGAIQKDLKQWDIIIPNNLVQHDMDARPIFEKFVIPCLKEKYIKANNKLVDHVVNLVEKEKNNNLLNGFGNIYKGLVATGDKFISSQKTSAKLLSELPEIFAVEMEGGSFAQVATQENIQWLVLRVISDKANDDADNDFNEFLKQYEVKSWDLLKIILENIKI